MQNGDKLSRDTEEMEERERERERERGRRSNLFSSFLPQIKQVDRKSSIRIP